MSCNEIQDDIEYHDSSHIVDSIFKCATQYTTILDISFWDLNLADYYILFGKLTFNDKIRVLHMRCKILPHHLFKPLSTFLMDHTTMLSAIDLQCSIFKDNDFKMFCESLQTNITIKELNLSACVFDNPNDVIDSLHSLLTTNKTLGKVKLHRVFINDKRRSTVDKACDMISKTSVKLLDITNNFHGAMPRSTESSEYSQMLIESLRHNIYIEAFILMPYMISPTTLNIIIDILQKDNYTLISLFENLRAECYRNEHFIMKKDMITKMLQRNRQNYHKRCHTLFYLSYSQFLQQTDDSCKELNKKIKRMRI